MNKRQEVLDKTDGRCAYCGEGLGFHRHGWHIEHVIPRFSGGTDDLANLVPACMRCNYSKGTKTLDEFRESVFNWANHLADELGVFANYLPRDKHSQFYDEVLGPFLEFLDKDPAITFYMESDWHEPDSNE